jgi:hypothetical protein
MTRGASRVFRRDVDKGFWTHVDTRRGSLGSAPLPNDRDENPIWLEVGERESPRRLEVASWRSETRS